MNYPRTNTPNVSNSRIVDQQIDDNNDIAIIRIAIRKCSIPL